MAKSSAATTLSRAVKPKIYDFLSDLQNDSTAAYLVHPIDGGLDRRVRLGRVDAHHRAILFQVDPKDADTTYIYMGTWLTDEATALAACSILRVHPATGALEGVVAESDRDSDARDALPNPAPVRTAGSIPAVPTAPILARAGYTAADLVEKLGLAPALAARAVAALDTEALVDLAADAEAKFGTWQGDTLLELAAGTSLAEIREKYRFAPESELDATDDSLIRALDHPASQMLFTYIGEDTAELRRIIEGGDFTAWRRFLHPEQRLYAEQDFRGAFRLSGGAGTGKTVVLVHRARSLLQRNPAARIILTTFNTTLAESLDTELRVLDPDLPRADGVGGAGVLVIGIDKLANQIVTQAADIGDAADALFGIRAVELPARRTDTDQLWQDVIHTTDCTGLEPRLATPGFLNTEYVYVVLANTVKSFERYAKTHRRGRRVRLTRKQKYTIWQLITAFRSRSQAERSLSFPEVIALAAAQLGVAAETLRTRIADHVLVDEAQDLHPSHWNLLRALTDEGPNDLFIAEDPYQRIYGQPISLGHLGIDIVGRSRRLTLNYRTTAQNLRFALGIVTGAEYVGVDGKSDSTAGYRSIRLGPVPALIPCGSVSDELQAIVQQVRAWVDSAIAPHTIAVLARTTRRCERVVSALAGHGIDAAILEHNPTSENHVQVMTMHRSKGMEFSRVILAGVGAKELPISTVTQSVPEEEKAEALLRERSLLYVAASRARDEVVVTWIGTKSELLG